MVESGITAAYKFLAQASGNPFRILDVALTSWKLLDGVRIDKVQLEVAFKDAPYRHPVDTGAFHRYLCNVIGYKRVTQSVKVFG